MSGQAAAIPEGIFQGLQQAIAEYPELEDRQDQLLGLLLQGIERNPPPPEADPDLIARFTRRSVTIIGRAIVEDEDLRGLAVEAFDLSWICDRWPDLWPFCRPLPEPEPPAPAAAGG